MELGKPILFAATADAPRSRKFYTEVLGLDFVADEQFALVFNMGEMMLRIQKVEIHSPPPYTVLGWQTNDIATTIDALTERGVAFERYDFMEQDERGIWRPPGEGAHIAWFKDPDGNTLSLTQFLF